MPSSYCAGRSRQNHVLVAPRSGLSKLLQVPSIERNLFTVGKEQLNNLVGSRHSAKSNILSPYHPHP